MKVYKGSCASPGLVLGQVSRLEHHVETTTVGPFKPSRELQLLTDAIRTAQDELESMADRAAPSEQAIFQDNAPPHLRRVLFNGIISAILFLQHLLSLIACNHIILKDVSCFF